MHGYLTRAPQCSIALCWALVLCGLRLVTVSNLI